MKSASYIIVISLLASTWYSCTKQERIDHIDSKAPAPQQIRDIKIKNMPGAAIITYKLPQDPNLSYVKAAYEIRSGIFREAKSSFYTDTLELVGFGDTLSHEVKIYSVGKNEKESAPVTVSVTPLTPPVKSVFSTLTLEPTFGGVQITFKNSSQANLEIVVMVDTLGQDTWSPVTSFYTGALEGTFSARGFDSTQKKFAVFIRDRWNNKSDTLIKSLSPFFEELIPKDTWKMLPLPNDTWQPAEAIFSVEKLWDGLINGYQGIFASTSSSTLPQWFTIDLGKKVVISRIVEHQQENDHLYSAGGVKRFELWGSNDPDSDGGWTNWQLLGSFQSFKPSGLPLGQVTAEDKNYGWFQGEDFVFDHALPAVRYLRWKTLETYSTTGQIVIAELDLWGQIQP